MWAFFFSLIFGQQQEYVLPRRDLQSNNEREYEENCDNNKNEKHGEFELPTPLVLRHVELNKDDAVGDEVDEDQTDHGETPGFKSCQTFRCLKKT